MRIEVWKQYRRTQDAPYRRKTDRRHGMRFVARNPEDGWADVLPFIGPKQSVMVAMIGRGRGRVIRVLIGSRRFLATRYGR